MKTRTASTERRLQPVPLLQLLTIQRTAATAFCRQNLQVALWKLFLMFDPASHVQSFADAEILFHRRVAITAGFLRPPLGEVLADVGSWPADFGPSIRDSPGQRCGHLQYRARVVSSTAVLDLPTVRPDDWSADVRAGSRPRTVRCEHLESVLYQ